MAKSIVTYDTTASDIITKMITHSQPAALSPTVRLYIAVTASLARKPLSVPVNVGSVAPYVLLAAAGVTDALTLLIVLAPFSSLFLSFVSTVAGLNTALIVYGPPATVSPAVRL